MLELDEVVHQSVRLNILVILSESQTDQADFTYLRRRLALTVGNLGVHLGKLEAAGYTRTIKTFVGKRPRTFIELTDKGQQAFLEHIRQLCILFSKVPGAEAFIRQECLPNAFESIEAEAMPETAESPVAVIQSGMLSAAEGRFSGH